MPMWKFIKSNNFALALTVAALACAALQYLVATTGFPDPDVYYHAAMARLLASHPTPGSFPWLPLTTLSDSFADLHYLYHLLMAPFASLPLLPWFTAALSLLMVSAFGLLLRRLKIPAIGFWILLLVFGSTDFLYRINLVKINSLALLLIFLGIMLMYRQRFWWLGLLSAVFVWTYGGFLVLLAVAALYSIAQAIVGKLTIKPVRAVSLGLLAGWAIQPDPAALLTHLYNQTVGVVAAKQALVDVGGEWTPYEGVTFLRENVSIILVWLVAGTWYLKRFTSFDREHRALLTWFFLLSLMFLAAALHSRRFVEYWVPLSVLFSGAVAGVAMTQTSWRPLRKHWTSQQEKIALMCLGLLLASCFVRNGLTAARYFHAALPAEAFAPAARWLREHSGPGDIVFNARWDEFPQLFYGNSHNRYVIGLDPTFLYLKSPPLYRSYEDISGDGVGNAYMQTLHAVIKNDFGASYIFLENARNPLLRFYLHRENARPYFSLVHSDAVTSVYEVR